MAEYATREDPADGIWKWMCPRPGCGHLELKKPDMHAHAQTCAARADEELEATLAELLDKWAFRRTYLLGERLVEALREQWVEAESCPEGPRMAGFKLGLQKAADLLKEELRREAGQ
jgi:hypothetical protein